MTNQAYILVARVEHGCEGSIEIDDNAAVSRSSDRGAYVTAWVWVEDESLPEGCGSEDDEDKDQEESDGTQNKQPNKQQVELLISLEAEDLSREWASRLPAPCEQELLENLPLFGGELEGELSMNPKIITIEAAK
jgi:hypothetical protein